MWNIVFYLALLTHTVCAFTHPAPKTVGEPWPLPQTYKPTDQTMNLNQLSFQFSPTAGSHDCNLLQAAIERTYMNIFGVPRDNRLKFKSYQPKDKVEESWNTILKNDENSGLPLDGQILQALDIILENDCEDYPSLQMNESCM